MKKNIIEKIWDAHVVQKKEGFPDIFAIDFHLIHEVTSPQAFEILRNKKLKIHAQERMIATVDHNIPTGKNRHIITNPASKKQIETLRKNCKEFGVQIWDVDSGKQGIVHVIGPENGLTQPGMTIVCGDSHTATHGAFGAIAFGIGTTEVSHVMATGCILQKKPKTMRVNFKGSLKSGVTAKDMILKLIQTIGIGGANGHIIEYCGKAIKNLSMEERMTICNMSIECGARAGLVAPDAITFEYLKDLPCSPSNKKWGQAVKHWSTFVSDEGCKYDKKITINISNMAPIVTWGTNPAQCEEVDIPIQFTNETDRKAGEYTKIKEGQSMGGVPIDYVFIGSCTNGRISDLREAANILKNKKISDSVIMYVVPGSEKVRNEAIAEGLDKIFIQAGAEFRNPGCSMCLAMNGDIVPQGKRCASTSNRNFIGRQGTGSITHLMSPAMAAAAAIAGKIINQ